MNKFGVRIVSVITLIALFVLVSAPPYLYFKGLASVPNDREPLTQLTIPESVAQSFWRYLGGQGYPSISPRTPYGFLIGIFVESLSMDSNKRTSAEYALLGQAARSLMFRDDFDASSGDWHLSNAAAFIWISRNWSADEAVATVLLDSYFGNGFQGIESAARGYFDTPLSELTEAQIVYLLVIRAAPTYYDPWCNPDTHRKRFEVFSERIGLIPEYDLIEALPVPPQTCD